MAVKQLFQLRHVLELLLIHGLVREAHIQVSDFEPIATAKSQQHIFLTMTYFILTLCTAKSI